MSDEYQKVLFKNQEAYPPEQLRAHLLEQYKIYLEMADRISSRRQSANSFFLSLNTALVALVSYLCLGAQSASWYVVVAVAGMAISYMWYRLVRSYKDLNTAKFKVVHEIESKGTTPSCSAIVN